MANSADIAAFHQKIKPETLWQKLLLVVLCFATVSPAMDLTGFGNVLPDWPLPVWVVLSALVGAFVGFTYYPQWRYGVVGILPGMLAGPSVLLLTYFYTFARERVFKAEMALVWVVGLAPAALVYYVAMRFIVLSTSRPTQSAPGAPGHTMPMRTDISPDVARDVYRAEPVPVVTAETVYEPRQRSIAPLVIALGIVAAGIMFLGVVVTVAVFSGKRTPPPIPAPPIPVVQQPAGIPQTLPSARGNQQQTKLNHEELAQLVADLKSNEKRVQRSAASRLAEVEVVPEDKHQVASALVELLNHSDFVLRRSAAQTLASWATPEILPRLVSALEGDDFVLRRHIIDALGKLGSTEAAEAIVSRLSVGADRPKAVEALTAMGALAENAVLSAVNHSDPFVRAEACRILGKIGSPQSQSALELATKDPNGLVSMAARQSLQSIKSRR